ncbi:Uncharacterized protein PCOAH_00002160 [Plasmodium coatneyi]|uniref:Uncharacterized protein n=1 Tax=Plasmodium coatneyi TaxID=208452 RepID=A0A1B1DSZ6_9APIC|nr:Uncharacterized protein PCOAH_00002160 [Plasmodium coatneyi]ANQ05900.1 Uncharacterized protein PCOAH_00002160 [Plasmodium coatneyi]
MMTPLYIQLILFTLFVCVWQTQGQCIVDAATLKASSSQSSSLRHRCGRMLSEYASSYDGRYFTDDSSTTLTGSGTDSISSDFSEDEDGHLQRYLTSRIHREREAKWKREFSDFVGSLDSVDSVGSRRKVLKKILSHLRKQETFDYDLLMDYIDIHLEGKQKKEMKLLVEELKKYKEKYLHTKYRFRNNMKNFRKKIKKHIMFLILLVPSITTLFVLLGMIMSMTICAPAALAAGPIVATTVVTSAAGAAASTTVVSSAAGASVGCGALADVVIPIFTCCGSMCKVVYVPLPLLL